MKFNLYVEKGTAGTLNGDFSLTLRTIYGLGSENLYRTIPVSEGWNEIKLKLSDLWLSRLINVSDLSQGYRCQKTSGIDLKYSGTDEPNVYVNGLKFCMPAQATVTKLTVDNNNDIQIEWNCYDKGATKYDVYRNGELIVNDTVLTSYKDTDVPMNRLNTYYVVSKDADGLEISVGMEQSRIVYDGSHSERVQLFNYGGNFIASIVNGGNGTAVCATYPSAKDYYSVGIENVKKTTSASEVVISFADSNVRNDLSKYVDEGYLKFLMYVKPAVGTVVKDNFSATLRTWYGTGSTSPNKLTGIHEGWNLVTLKLSEMNLNKDRIKDVIGLEIRYSGSDETNIYMQDVFVYIPTDTVLTKVERNGKNINLEWATKSEAKEYDVYRADTIIAENVKGLTYTDFNPVINALNLYKIVAKDSDGNVINESEYMGTAVYDDEYYEIYSFYSNADRDDNTLKSSDKSGGNVSEISSETIIPGTSAAIIGAPANGGIAYRFEMNSQDVKWNMKKFQNDGILRFLMKFVPSDASKVGKLEITLNSSYGNVSTGRAAINISADKYGVWMPVEIKLSDLTSVNADRVEVVNGISITYDGRNAEPVDIYLQDIGFWGNRVPAMYKDADGNVVWTTYDSSANSIKLKVDGCEKVPTIEKGDALFLPLTAKIAAETDNTGGFTVYSADLLDSSDNEMGVWKDVYYNNSDNVLTATFVAAVYNDNGLEDIMVQKDVTVSGKGLYWYDVDGLKVSADNKNPIVKKFVFSGLDSLKPLSVSVER